MEARISSIEGSATLAGFDMASPLQRNSVSTRELGENRRRYTESDTRNQYVTDDASRQCRSL
jgi:hypothetical protein